MNHKILITLIVALASLMVSCHKEENDIFSTAYITLRTPDSASITNIQAQAVVVNVNTRQTTTSSQFRDSRLEVELLRGAYSVTIEGVVTVSDGIGNERIRQFRAQSDYVDLSHKTANHAELNILYLD